MPSQSGKVAAIAGFGLLLAWSGLSNKGVLATTRDIIQGTRPVPGTPQQFSFSLGGDSSSTNGTSGTVTTQGDSLTTMSNSGLSVDGGSPAAHAAVGFAVAQVGKWYGWGKTGPDQYDCSGLVYAAYKSVSITIPRVTEMQIVTGTLIPNGSEVPGDLMFPEPGHVVMCIGGGQCVEAAHTGTQIRVRGYDRNEFVVRRRYA